ncbi:MAG: cupin domain-containing protein [Haloarculaceae archaeon]
MHVIDTDTASGFFDVVGGTERSRAATMILDPGEETGGPSNSHPDNDQWLYVKSGAGTAVIEGEEQPLSAGDLVLIEAGETHAISAGDAGPLETINVYAPPR